MDTEHGDSDCCGGQSPPRALENDSRIGHNSADSPQRPSGLNSLEVSDSLDIPSPALTDTLSEGWAQHCRSVRKSRTHDCVMDMGMGLQAAPSPGGRSGSLTATVRSRRRLVNSASFSGFGVTPSMLLQENQSVNSGSREIIDYRNLTPQVPFVPSIAKSIPKKRISLRKPRKAIKDLFGIKKHKHEKAVSPCSPCPRVGDNGAVSKRVKKPSRHTDHTSPGYLAPHEHNELMSDSSSDCANVCEDAASLKSFGSQAGCGEIFADEEHLTSLEAVLKQDPDKNICELMKRSPMVAAFQGGMEQLASPAHAEVLDLFGMWDSLSRSILYGQNSRTEGKATANTTPIAKTPTPTTLGDNFPVSPLPTPDKPAESKRMDLSTDTVTPKSENQETTSDEGYYDYVSPGLEELGRGYLTPLHSGKFPRDTYSGDALYELFYDPSEAEMTPIFDDEMNIAHSIIGQSSDLPLSMYSFRVGAEENLAPPLALDFISQEVLQSNWVGKECLLKLCDTEISLAMGIVNWLKQKTVKTNPSDSKFKEIDSAERGDVCLGGEAESPEVKEVPNEEAAVDENCKEERFDSKENGSCQQDSRLVSVDIPSKLSREESTAATPDSNGHVESQLRTPTSGVCFRIFNIDSPLTPSRDLQSPMARTPGSGTSSVFLLAINKESLCESCRKSLKQGAKELHLCPSCVSLIEHIKTSELWNRASLHRSPSVGTPQSLTGAYLPSPISPGRAGKDINIVRLMEQCASQVSTMKINGSHKVDHEKAVFEAKQDAKAQKSKEQSRRYLKSKHMVREKVTEKSSLHAGKGTHESSHSEDLHDSSLLETEGLGLVTTNGSEDLVLETYRSPSLVTSEPCCLGDTDPVQAPRPTFLPLSNSAYSDFASSKSHPASQAKEGSTAKGKTRERLWRHKKSSMNRDGTFGCVFPEERKVERKRRMKK